MSVDSNTSKYRTNFLAAAEAKDWQKLIAMVPYAADLGIQYLTDENCFYLPFNDRFIGNRYIRAIHGGIIGSFMENVALIHAAVGERQASIPNPINMQVDYLRSAADRDCFARCDTTRQGRRVANIAVRCWQENEQRPVAAARSHLLLDNQ